jgi:mRNA interferase HigB
MRIISRKAFRTFSESHPESTRPLDEFYLKLKRCSPNNLPELRETFPSADLVGDCIVFNVGGNKYRVIVHLDFEVQTMWIRFVLTHAEYAKDRWKDDC